MTWQAGRWSVTDETANLPDSWGKLRSFTVEMGRGPGGDVAYLGATCTIEFENGDAWTDYSADARPDPATDTDPVHRIDGLAIRWAPAAVTWPKGPPAIFAGWISGADVNYTPGEDGTVLVTATATAEDWLALTRRTHTAVSTIDATSFKVLRDHCRGGFDGGHPHPLIRLSTWGTTGAVSGDAGQWSALSDIWAMIQQAMDATGGEAWLRHGERLAPAPASPPADPPGAWRVPRPELIARPVGGHSTRDAPNIIYAAAGSTATTVYSGAPITRRYQIDLDSAEVTVGSPVVLDRVQLISAHDGHTATATTDWSPAFNRAEMQRSGILDPGPVTDTDRSTMTAAAQRFLDFNTQAFRHVEILLQDLTDDQITYWAPIGIGDEVSLPTRYRLAALHGADPDRVPFIAQVRHIAWSATPEATDLTLGVAHYPGALSLLTATLTAGYNNLSVYGWGDPGPSPPGYGEMTDHQFNAFDGTPVRIRWIADNYSGDETLQLRLETEPMGDAVQGMWLVIDGRGWAIDDAARSSTDRSLFTWAGRQPGWRLGGTYQIEITAEQPDQLQPYSPYSRDALPDEVWHSRIIVGRAGTTEVYGYRIPFLNADNQRWGALIDGNRFDRGGATRYIYRIEWDGDATADNIRLDFASTADAVAAEGLWLWIGGHRKHLLASSARTGDAYTWHDPVLTWTRGQFTELGLYTDEPPTPAERVYRATITVGHQAGWDGWYQGQYGASTGSLNLQYGGISITMTSVRYHDTTDTMRLATANQTGNQAIAGLWVRMGNVVHELTGSPDQYGWAWDPPQPPNWTETGHTVDLELWTADPTGL